MTTPRHICGAGAVLGSIGSTKGFDIWVPANARISSACRRECSPRTGNGGGTDTVERAVWI